MFFETEGIVLKRSKMLESDMMLTVYTKDYGLVKLVASGARRKGSGISMSAQLFSTGNLLYNQTNNYNRVRTFEPNASGFMISKSLKSISFASYFSELVIKAVPEYAGGRDIFDLLEESFKALTDETNNFEFLRCIFELKFLRILGYDIMLSNCSRCSAKENLNYFSVVEGGIICDNCHMNAYESYKIGNTIPKIIEFIMVSPMEVLLKTDIAHEYLKKIQTLTLGYYRTHLNIAGLKSLEMVGIFNK